MRANITLEQMRISWEKGEHPLIKLFTWRSRPSIKVRSTVNLSTYPGHSSRPDTPLLILFQGSLAEMRDCTHIVLDFPGGGFVSMKPEHHEDYLRVWARRTGAVVVSVNYGKAPEYPYPWAIDECFSVWRMIQESNGRCIGLSGENEIRIALAGDSA